MTISTTTPATTPPAAAGAAEARRSRTGVIVAIVIVVVVLLFAATYALAWSQANRLSAQYLHDADSSYDAGKYPDALVGGQKFNPNTNNYVDVGGYLQVQHIWASDRAWPKPNYLGNVQSRIDEIINQKLTVDEAQQFVQENTGKQNPYLGIIYLRLGELYAAQGDTKDARDIFEAIPSSFPNDPQLIERAKQDLAKLGG